MKTTALAAANTTLLSFRAVSRETSRSTTRWENVGTSRRSATYPPTAAPEQQLALASARAAYPVVRLLFKPEPGSAPLALCYGNREAAAPRYDLALVACRILAAEKSAAVLGTEEKFGGDRSSPDLLGRLRGGPLFWGVLALVIVTLLVVVAKLLPKPPAA